MNKLNKIIVALLITVSVNAFANNCPALYGEFVIGSSERADFSTINEAINSLKCGGVSGPVSFKIESGKYNERVVISSIPGVSSFNPVKFESATGNNADVVISYGTTDAAMVINSSYVTLENITIDHKDGTYGNCMRVEGKSSGLHFNNVVFNGVDKPQAGANNAAIYFASTASKSDVSFEDCEVNYGSMGIWKSGVSAANPDSKTLVQGTLFFGQTEAGLVLVNEDAPIVNSNVVSTLVNKNGYKAISLDNVSNQMIVTRNIMNTSSGATGLVLNNCVAQDKEAGQISNNTITINGNTDAMGISLTGNTDNQVLSFNRVKLAINTAHVSGQGYYRNVCSGNSVNMMNNIFVDMNTGVYTIIGNSYKDFFNQFPGQSNSELSANANSLSVEKVSAIK